MPLYPLGVERVQTALWAAAIEQLDYVNNRDFTVDAQLPDGATNPLVGDLAPEGLVFIRASESPNRKPLLVVGNEVSGTTTIYQIDVEVSAKGNKH